MLHGMLSSYGTALPKLSISLYGAPTAAKHFSAANDVSKGAYQYTEKGTKQTSTAVPTCGTDCVVTLGTKTAQAHWTAMKKASHSGDSARLQLKTLATANAVIDQPVVFNHGKNILENLAANCYLGNGGAALATLAVQDANVKNSVKFSIKAIGYGKPARPHAAYSAPSCGRSELLRPPRAAAAACSGPKGSPSARRRLPDASSWGHA